MEDLFKPIELWLHRNLGAGELRRVVFEGLRLIHLYLGEYYDYLLFGLLAVPLYYLVPRRLRPAYLLLASLLMIQALFGMAFTLGLWLVPLGFYLLTERAALRYAVGSPELRHARSGLALGVVAVYALLILRESLDFELVSPFSGEPFVMPLLHFCGIAFALPKLLHYIFDRLDGSLPRPAGALRFSLFMAFFPILRMGPIERYPVFARDLDAITTRRLAPFDIAYGLYRIALGLAKSALYTGWLLPFRQVNTADLTKKPPEILYTLALCGALEVYCHFGGYTDIANGFARLFGFRLSENFYLPFFSTSIAEWWRRWHISLSFWLRDYVYRPLGGTKHALRNALITFTICGAWHYLSWHYILWGLLQGVGLAGHGLWRAFWATQRKRVAKHPELPVGRLLAFVDRQPLLVNTVSAVLTLHYFCLCGVYFVFSVDDGTTFLLRLFRLMV